MPQVHLPLSKFLISKAFFFRNLPVLVSEGSSVTEYNCRTQSSADYTRYYTVGCFLSCFNYSFIIKPENNDQLE